MSKDKNWYNNSTIFCFEKMRFECNECLKTEDMKDGRADAFINQASKFRESHKTCRFNSVVKSQQLEITNLKSELATVKDFSNRQFEKLEDIKVEMSAVKMEGEGLKQNIESKRQKIKSLEIQVENLTPKPLEFLKDDLITLYSDNYLRPMEGKVLNRTGIIDQLVTVELYDLGNKTIVTDVYPQQLRHR